MTLDGMRTHRGRCAWFGLVVCAIGAQITAQAPPALAQAPSLQVPGAGPAAANPAPAVDATPAAGQPSGLPVPRFVSLKSNRVNLRNGPGTDFPTSWVFRRAGLPLEVIKEFEGWRQVRDADGTTGWVVQSFLSGRRTALVLPWEIKADTPVPQVKILNDGRDGAGVVAIVEAGVIASILSCDGRWCQVAIDRYRGYLEQKTLWGVYEREIVK